MKALATSTWPSDVRGLGTELIAPFKKKQMATWNVQSLYRLEERTTVLQLTAIQETRWIESTPQAFSSNVYNIYTSSLCNKHEFATAFLVDSKHNLLVMNFTPIDQRLCMLRVKCNFFFNYSLIKIHAPTNDSDNEAKYLFYEELKAQA
jgi:hypothetical protein